MALVLDHTELYELTRRQRPSAQARALRQLGIEHRRRADGSIVVLRANAEKALGGEPSTPRPPADQQPNWDAL